MNEMMTSVRGYKMMTSFRGYVLVFVLLTSASTMLARPRHNAEIGANAENGATGADGGSKTADLVNCYNLCSAEFLLCDQQSKSMRETFNCIRLEWECKNRCGDFDVVDVRDFRTVLHGRRVLRRN